MPTIMEVEEPQEDLQVTERTSNSSSKECRPILPPFALPKRRTRSRKVNGILTGSKHNSIKNASRRRIQTLIEMQNASNRIEKLCKPTEKNVCKTPQDWDDIEFNAPNPEGSAPPPFQLMQEEEEEEEEEEPTVRRLRRFQQLKPIRIQSPTNTVTISQDSVPCSTQ